ncbi:MAG: aminotransferase class V-fold PLP-dependent enzyme [Alphaproteobacteria bacterium]|nr:aminotransferase class V-fold PLP-dependent enzyme [Alphaproteobacteria bacterium]MBU0797083.1 aminotransferase class V-fold PLP-dependent enzyme [Alphaproteobacteria bacterium]MBU0887890.1 aminotransferase class V-fold PLP-dependent enzyme [Alphaproteobacteria bacterium]MBU1814887.1 aminotransferase class V-fold PLP-dependent enzyme [Alphaproteobacteria bacterium]
MAASLGQAVRHHWNLREDIVFLNHGSYGATPEPVLAEQRRWRDRMESNPVNFMKRVLPDALESAKARLAAFLGAGPADLAFVDNATSGVNTVLRSLDFQPGDEILINSHTYNAVKQTCLHIAARSGAVLVEADIPYPLSGPQPIVEAITARLSARTRLVILDHITSPTATIMPLAPLIAAAKAAGALVLVDGAHAPGMLPLDLPAIGADYYTGNCHKWLCAPKGCAFLWVDPARQDGIHPLTISHYYGKGFSEEFAWTGTRDASAWLAVTAALDFLDALGGLETVTAYTHRLARDAAAMLADAWGTEIGCPPAMRGTMACIRLPDRYAEPAMTSQMVMDRLWQEYRIEIPVLRFAGQAWARISAAPYNEMAEYTVLKEAIGKW